MRSVFWPERGWLDLAALVSAALGYETHFHDPGSSGNTAARATRRPMEKPMIGLEVQLNGQPACIATVGEEGVLTAMVTRVARSGDQASPGEGRGVTLHVSGLVGPRRYTWIPFQELKAGDVVEVKVVDMESADEAIKAAHVEMAPEGKPGWFDEARARLRKGER
jgi:hypothetical protein